MIKQLLLLALVFLAACTAGVEPQETQQQTIQQAEIDVLRPDTGLNNNIPEPRAFEYTCGATTCDISADGVSRAWLTDAATAITCQRAGRYENVTCAGATLSEKGDIMMLEIESHLIDMKQAYERNLEVEVARSSYVENNTLE